MVGVEGSRIPWHCVGGFQGSWEDGNSVEDRNHRVSGGRRLCVTVAVLLWLEIQCYCV